MSSNQVPTGFRFAGVESGIKPSRKPDLSLIFGDSELVAAGVYTTNQIVAAPVLLCRQRTPSGAIRAVVTNSGNANACTGSRGERDANRMCQLVADRLGIQEDQVLVMSTGIIGQHLPMNCVEAGIKQAAQSLADDQQAFDAAAQAILTTDQGQKTVHHSIEFDGQQVRISAMAKGAGMIAPNMATMLAVVMTDAKLEPSQAQRLLHQAADRSFNCVSVDGHMSTNDTMLLLASGATGVTLTDEREQQFVSVLEEACVELAKQLVADGEGASHVMQIAVRGAVSDADADQIARAIGESPLVKTAAKGNDPNWGRIVSAAGYAGPTIQPQKTSLTLCGTVIYQDGGPVEFDAAVLSQRMAGQIELQIQLVVGDGDGKATRWASDLTEEYVRFNSEYTT